VDAPHQCVKVEDQQDMGSPDKASDMPGPGQSWPGWARRAYWVRGVGVDGDGNVLKEDRENGSHDYSLNIEGVLCSNILII
jgi:hypothetical protein